MVGGAEKSTYEILKQESDINRIRLLSFSNLKIFNAINNKIDFPSNWRLNLLNNMFQFQRFFYYEYLFNRNKIKRHFKNEDSNQILYTYSIYAPIAINSFQGKSKLFIRSESDLAINNNYYKGIKKYFKYIYMILEWPAFYIYQRDLKKAINKSEVICNSEYMKNRLKDLFGKDSKVIYPYVDKKRLQEDFLQVQTGVKNKGIVFIGDSIIKGVKIAKEIAKNMPNKKFYFFSRFVIKSYQEQNIIYMPWQKREVDIYKYAKIVIVPSIWEEAYGRVSREAYILNIPVLVSNIGGLPESVNKQEELIINNYKNINEWIQRIEKNI